MESGSEAPTIAPAVDFCIDLRYEFSAPQFFDFSTGETEEEAAAAEKWFQGAVTDSASPFVGKVKPVCEMSKGCSLEEYIEVQKLVARISPEPPKEMETDGVSADGLKALTTSVEEESTLKRKIGTAPSAAAIKDEPYTPKHQFSDHFAELKSLKATHDGYNIPPQSNQLASHTDATSQIVKAVVPSSKRSGVKRCLEGPPKAQNSQATKKHRLDGGQSCKLWHTKTPRALPTLTVPQEFHFQTQQRAHIYKETGQCSLDNQAQSSIMPYIPVAEMVQRFQMNLLGELRTQDKLTRPAKRNLKLTRPKEPMLGTSLRARPPTVKSFAEQEEEMLANMCKFKAHPLNKRILEGPTLPPLPRSTPQLPEFQEFHLRTMERALLSQHTQPSVEYVLPGASMEQGLETMPKFKARPINKRIFSSRGEVGVFTVPKRQATIPKGFHFATDERAQLRAHCHDATITNRHSQEERLLDRSRSMCAPFVPYVKATREQNARVSLSCGLPNTALLMDSVENHTVHHERAALELTSCQELQLSSNAFGFPGPQRKPLGEIQSHFVFAAAAATQTAHKYKIDNKYVENNPSNHEDGFFPQSHVKTPLYTVEENERFPIHTRPSKDLFQRSTPSYVGRAEVRQQQKASFPVHYMR